MAESSGDLRFLFFERELERIKNQLIMYVPLRENDLQLKDIRETVDRIERQFAIMSDKILAQEHEALLEKAAMQQKQATLQIKILWGTISTVIGFMTSVFVAYVTHFFH